MLLNIKISKYLFKVSAMLKTHICDKLSTYFKAKCVEYACPKGLALSKVKCGILTLKTQCELPFWLYYAS